MVLEERMNNTCGQCQNHPITAVVGGECLGDASFPTNHSRYGMILTLTTCIIHPLLQNHSVVELLRSWCRGQCSGLVYLLSYLPLVGQRAAGCTAISSLANTASWSHRRTLTLPH